MVFAEFERGFVEGPCDSSGIASVGAVGPLGSDQDNVGSAASMRLLLVFGAIVLILHLFLDGHYLFFS